jgi:hypothetical protein
LVIIHLPEQKTLIKCKTANNKTNSLCHLTNAPTTNRHRWNPQPNNLTRPTRLTLAAPHRRRIILLVTRRRTRQPTQHPPQPLAPARLPRPPTRRRPRKLGHPRTSLVARRTQTQDPSLWRHRNLPRRRNLFWTPLCHDPIWAQNNGRFLHFNVI